MSTPLRRVSGPISYNQLANEAGTQLMLFGDEHSDRKGGCKQCRRPDCVTITRALTELLRSKTSQVDVFLETSPLDISKGRTHLQAAKRLYRKNAATSGNRVHWVDVRDMYPVATWGQINQQLRLFGQRPHLSQVLNFLWTHHPTLDTWCSYLDAFVLDDRPRQNLPSYARRGVELTRIGNKHVHRVRKQVLKLRPADQAEVLRFYAAEKRNLRDICGRTFDALVQQELNSPTDLSPRAYQRQLALMVILLQVESLLMDIYTISRILYYVGGSDSSAPVPAATKPRTAVVYAGAAHTSQIRKFFAEQLRWRTVAVQFAPGTPLRCVHV